MASDLIAILAVLGALDSLYTAFQQKYPKLFAFCFDRNFKRVSCYEILHSAYARIFIIPNSWLGVFSYILLAIIFSATKYYFIGALIASIGLVFSYYLLYVQAFILKKYCIFCLTSTALITIITVLAWL